MAHERVDIALEPLLQEARTRKGIEAFADFLDRSLYAQPVLKKQILLEPMGPGPDKPSIGLYRTFEPVQVTKGALALRSRPYTLPREAGVQHATELVFFDEPFPDPYGQETALLGGVNREGLLFTPLVGIVTEMETVRRLAIVANRVVRASGLGGFSFPQGSFPMPTDALGQPAE